LHVVQVAGHHPGLVDGKLDEPFLHRRRGDPDGDLAFAGDGQFGELACLVGKFFFVLGIYKNKLESFQAASSLSTMMSSMRTGYGRYGFSTGIPRRPATQPPPLFTLHGAEVFGV
jgi:hypothetical protein